MNLREAIAGRYSVRAFRPDPVPAAMVRDLIDAARRAPSGGNVQPWQVVALSGDPLAALVRDVTASFDASRQEASPFPIYPERIRDSWMARRRECGFALYASLGIERDDRIGRALQHRRNFEAFGAPAVLFFVIDETAGPPQWADMGMFMQTLMLLAVEAGLGTCAQAAWATWPQTLARHLDLAPGLIVTSGLALGWPDPAHPVNRWRTTRASVDQIVTMIGFEDPPTGM